MPIGASAGSGGILGTIGKALPVLGDIGRGAGAAADTAAGNRSTLAQLNTMRDRNVIDAESEYQTAQNNRAELDLKRRAADQASRKSGYSDALKADYLQNWTPAQRPRRVPMVTGGFNTVTDDMRDKSKEMERQAMLRLLSGEQFDPMEAPQRVPVSAVPTASGLERAGGVLSTIGSLTPAALSLLRRRS